MKIKVTLPDGSVMKQKRGDSPMDVARSIGSGLARDAVAAKVNGHMMDLSTPLEGDAEIAIITVDTPEGLEILRHSTSHVMASAVERLFDEVSFGIGPAIDNGFYYDFDIAEPISAEDLVRIEEEMWRIVDEELPFERIDVTKEEARHVLEERGEKYKLELLEEIEEGEVSLYRTGEFVDLCRGPHVPHTGRLRAFKLLSVAGAYWRGDSSRPQLQRIYGTAFASEKELEDYLYRLKEAEKRDHRVIGRQLDLFSMDEEIGQGLILWHPRGTELREAIESYWKKEHRNRGYQFVSTPHIASEELYRRSGHIPQYEDLMYAPLEIEGKNYRVKPMNCPGHIKIFQSKMRSYRDLPIRYAELGTVYRYEMSGALHGMLRVRGFTQDDAHIFCTPQQLAGEVEELLGLVDEMMGTFGYEYQAYLSTRPEVSLQTATDEEWERATEALKEGLEARGIDYEVDEGAGTFYAPKIDVKLYDAIGREWQGPTIQVDLNLPKRFGVSYIGDDGEEHECIIVHRAILGSLERFVGGLIEHFAGWFPVWLAPEQVRILPITDDHHEYAHRVRDLLSERGVRVTSDDRNEKTGYKVHEANDDKVPYMLIVGDREVENGTVSVRSHENGDEGPVATEEFIERITREIADKVLPGEMQG
jgi:threonyl-tRNA synthetase